MVFALGRLQLIEVIVQIVHDFCGGLNDGQWRAELVRHHGHKFVPQLPQLLFSRQRPEQFSPRSPSAANIVGLPLPPCGCSASPPGTSHSFGGSADPQTLQPFFHSSTSYHKYMTYY
jgi:hypothetical protein